MIRIEETKNEYLLFIPPDQKERARGIQGRKWDKQRLCWVYPRNVRMYNALVSEFGDDLTPDSSFTSPQSFPRSERSDDQETKEFRNSIEKIEQTLSELLKFLSHADNKRANILMSQDREIQSLRAESQEKDGENADLNRQIDKLQAENRRLSNEIKASSDAGKPSDRDDIVREIAIKVTGNDPVFGEAIRSLQVDGTIPLQIGSIIENHLKQVLNPSEKLSLYELIELCRDAEILDEESVSLAHFIRKQRNIRAHTPGSVDPRIELGRGLFCLFGASLLFPEIPEIENQ